MERIPVLNHPRGQHTILAPFLVRVLAVNPSEEGDFVGELPNRRGTYRVRYGNQQSHKYHVRSGLCKRHQFVGILAKRRRGQRAQDSWGDERDIKVDGLENMVIGRELRGKVVLGCFSLT